jgi:hypothetical protein
LVLVTHNKKFLILSAIYIQIGTLKEDKNEDPDDVSPQNVTSLIDSFIEQMLQTRKIFTYAL